MRKSFGLIALTPAGHPDPSIAIAACRAGCVGVYNAEIDPDPERLRSGLDKLTQYAHAPFGLKLSSLDGPAGRLAREYLERGLEWLVLDAGPALENPARIGALRGLGCKVPTRRRSKYG